MQVHYDIHQLPRFNNAVVTIGTFDGVHTGHKHVLEQLILEGKKVNGATVVVTFDPHPRMVIDGKNDPIYLLTTTDEKIELLASMDIDHLMIVPFNENFANQPASAYIHNFLFDKFRPHTVIIGYDHKFGKNREGDYRLLEAEALRLGFGVKEIPQHILNAIAISSTNIRKALLHNEPQIANKLLGYSYSFEGTVVEGNKLGRTLGFPTANIVINNADKLVPGNGVYAVKVKSQKSKIKNKNAGLHLFKGMMNIGTRPTIGGTQRVIEVNIFDFNEDIYGQIIRVFVEKFIRPELKFDNLEALKMQMYKDKEDAV